MKLWNDLRGWATAKQAALRLSFRMTVAAILAYVLAEMLALPQGYWAVFSSIITMQTSVGGSVKATIDRVLGTIGGAVAGAIVAYFVPHQNLVSLGIALVVALVPLTLLAALRPNYRVAPVTAIIVLITPSAQQLGPLESAFYRILEITLGCLVGLVVSLVVVPARAHGMVIGAVARMLGHLADLLGDWLAILGNSGDRTRITQLQDDIRAGMARLEIVADEARHERRTYLTDEFDPDPLVRTVVRLRNDLVMIGRAGAEPLPEPIVIRLREPIEQVSATGQSFLRACAEALQNRKNPPSLDPLEQALTSFVATIEQLRREGAIREFPADSAGRVFALNFALEQMRHNFEDFRDRVTECARAESAG